ncbi:MAG: transporter [Rariglobus sp.]|jgi:subfamily B ATP-binding cassette protein MsbA|nr:transporter [Rariglobus sp.]
MRRFLPYASYFKPVRWQLAGGLMFGLIYGAASGYGMPYMLETVFPRVFTEGAPVLSNWEVLKIALWLPFVLTIRGVSDYLNTYLIQYCGTRVLEQLRLRFFSKLQVLPLAFLQRNSSGDLISRGMSDTNQLQATISNLANVLVKQPATLIGAVVYVTYLAYRESGVGLVLVCLFSVPVCVLPIHFAGKKLVRRAKQLQTELGSLTGLFNENIAATREVRAFGLEAREIARFSVSTRLLLTYQMKVVKYAKALPPAIEIISAFGLSATFVYAYRVDLSKEAFLALIMALYVCYEPIKKLAALSNDTKRGAAALDRLEYVLNEPVSIADPVNPAVIGRVNGDLVFENVTFAYKNDEAALKSVSATIPAGTVCALVGPSGAGKSTFANLVPRFFDARSGRLTLDGIDIRDLRLADLRANIAVVSQDPFLFNDTIYNNLLLGRETATREEVEQAARDANAHDFIMSLPAGYDTIVGERGASLSGGQRQRIALARAFLRNAPLLILDEATSALDSESESAIQQALKKLVVDKTVLMIAHRFSTIRDASLIIVFDRGRIVDSGTHADLYVRSPLYKALYDQQNAAAF